MQSLFINSFANQSQVNVSVVGFALNWTTRNRPVVAVGYRCTADTNTASMCLTARAV